MADVKAITDCRTLTLQAKDFVELLLVVFFFCKTSNTHDPLLFEIKHNPVRLSCTSSGSLLLFIISSSILFLARSILFLAQSCLWLPVFTFAEPPGVQTQSTKIDRGKSWRVQEKGRCNTRTSAHSRTSDTQEEPTSAHSRTSDHSRRTSAREGLLESVWALHLPWW